MRGFFIGFAGLAITGFFGFAHAAEINTYRAGQPYQKIMANDYRQCAAQCRGDAACRGWNFVRPNINASSGICEFNSRLADPAPSPLSISGAIITKIDPVLSRAVPGSNSHTIRIGTPIVAKKPSAKKHSGPARKTVRQPARRSDAAMPTIHKMPNMAQKQNNIAKRIMAKPSNPPLPVTRLSREQVYKMHLQAAQRKAAQSMDMRRRQSVPGAGFNGQRKIVKKPPPAQNAPIPALSEQEQNLKPIQEPVQKPIQKSGQKPVLAETTNSLYGSLNDDLTKNMTPVPRPKTAPDRPDDPDAPISTVNPVPVTPVKSETVIPPGLAGGQ